MGFSWGREYAVPAIDLLDMIQDWYWWDGGGGSLDKRVDLGGKFNVLLGSGLSSQIGRREPTEF